MVGEASNSSHRSCVRKNNMIEEEEEETLIYLKVFHYPAQTSDAEHTIADSPSYGSFTAEKQILKKKVEKDGEEIKKVY